MVQKAIANNITELGFSDHIPLPYYRFHILKGLGYTLKDHNAFLVALKTIGTNGPTMRMTYTDKNIHLKVVKKNEEKISK